MAANVTVGNKAGLTQAKEKFFYKVRLLHIFYFILHLSGARSTDH